MISTYAIADRSTIELEVTINQPDLTVFADGSSLFIHPLTAGETTTFGSNTRFGMEADRDRRSRFDWFQVDAP